MLDRSCQKKILKKQYVRRFVVTTQVTLYCTVNDECLVAVLEVSLLSTSCKWLGMFIVPMVRNGYCSDAAVGFLQETAQFLAYLDYYRSLAKKGPVSNIRPATIIASIKGGSLPYAL